MNFIELPDLAAARLGGKVLAANDEFFAPKDNLLKPGRGVFIADKYTGRGKWMDGWETRRRRTSGHDWCIIRLGLRGAVRGINVDTNHFIGNYPEYGSLDACDASGNPSAKTLAGGKIKWTEILPKSSLKGGVENLFPVGGSHSWTHVRFNIYPDGGVARLRIHGDVTPDWTRLRKLEKPVDLAAVENGGLVIASSDMFFGSRNNMIMPGRAKNMGDGWETKRRRGPGHDWAIVRLGAAGTIQKIEVDTNHFKGNYPESCSMEGYHAPGASAEDLQADDLVWDEIVSRAKLKAHHRHFFGKEIRSARPYTHVRLNIFPDGGVSRLRIYGKFTASQ